MFEPTSRYSKLETAQLVDAAGRVIVYVRRRFLPDAAAMPTIAETAVQPQERLDVLTARTLGDPEHFWRVCDANEAMRPNDLLESEDLLRIPLPQP